MYRAQLLSPVCNWSNALCYTRSQCENYYMET